MRRRSWLPKLPSEKDLERHLNDVGAPPQEKEKEKPKVETKPKKPADNQLDIALDLLKSWGIFKTVAKGK